MGKKNKSKVRADLTRVEKKSTRKVQKRTYRAPRADHISGNFSPRGGWERSPADLGLIIRRSRDLVHNSPFAGRAIDVLTSYLVGTGIRIAVNGDPEYAAAYRKWSESTDVDYDGHLDLAGHTSLAARTAMEAGNAFIIVRDIEGPDGNIYPQLQAVDPELLAQSALPKIPGNRVVFGAEIDPRHGRAIGFHFYEYFDPMTSQSRTFFVAAKDIIHIFEKVYPGQILGIPRGSQALTHAADMDQAIQTVLVKMKTEACLGVAITVADGEEYDLVGDDQDVGVESDPLPETLSPGLILRLRQGEDVKTITPTSSSGYIDILRLSGQAIATAYRVTTSQIMSDPGMANFSSMKAELNLFQQGIDETRKHCISPFVVKIEKLFRQDYELNEGREVRATTTVIPPRIHQIDPQKQSAATISELAAGILLLSDVVLERGKDPAEHFAQLKAEREMLAQMGIVVSFIPPVIAPDPEDEDDEVDEQDEKPSRDRRPPSKS